MVALPIEVSKWKEQPTFIFSRSDTLRPRRLPPNTPEERQIAFIQRLLRVRTTFLTCARVGTARFERARAHKPITSKAPLRSYRKRPGRRAAEQRDEIASSHVEHGGVLPPALCQRSAPRVSRSGREVLGQHLKCSELH